MPFIKVDRANGDATFTATLISTVEQLNTLHATLLRLNARMQEMNAEQVEQLYGVPGKGDAVRTQVSDALEALDTTPALVNLRTKLG